MTAETKLAAAVTLGKFLLDEYASQMAHIDVPQFLADVIDLCQRFGIHFDAALEAAEAKILPDAPQGEGSDDWKIEITHIVEITDFVWVRADDEQQAVATAKSYFHPTWKCSHLKDVIVGDVLHDGPVDENEPEKSFRQLGRMLSGKERV